MGLVRFAKLAKDIAVVGAKGFWNTPVNVGVAKADAEDAHQMLKRKNAELDGFRALSGDPILKEFTVIKPASSH